MHALIFLCLQPRQPALDFLWARFVTNLCVLELDDLLPSLDGSVVDMLDLDSMQEGKSNVEVCQTYMVVKIDY